MSALNDYRNYERRQKAKGFKRKGVRLPGDAAAQLEELCWKHRLTESEVVARLLLGLPLDGNRTTENPFGLSPDELRHARLQGYAS